MYCIVGIHSPVAVHAGFERSEASWFSIFILLILNLQCPLHIFCLTWTLYDFLLLCILCVVASNSVFIYYYKSQNRTASYTHHKDHVFYDVWTFYDLIWAQDRETECNVQWGVLWQKGCVICKLYGWSTAHMEFVVHVHVLVLVHYIIIQR